MKMILKFHIKLCMIFFPFFCSSQQAEIGHIQNYSQTYLTSIYNSKFITSSSGPVLFNKKTEFYSSKNVKTVEVTVRNGAVIWRLKLDTAGNIISTEFRGGGYLIEHKEFSLKENEHTDVLSYYEDGLLVRIDSTTRFTRQHTNNDTIIKYSGVASNSYKIGCLINDQNRYYNSNYMGKEWRNEPFDVYPILISNSWDSSIYEVKNPNYFYVPFKTDYDSLRLYHCLSQSQITNEVYAYLNVAENFPEIFNNLNHPFIKNKKIDEYYHCYTEGESFKEPYFEQFLSHSIDNTNYEYNNGHNSGYLYDDNGLITEFYHDFYRKDTAATRIAKMEAKRISATNDSLAISDSSVKIDVTTNYPYRNVVRQKIPIRLDTYYFKYEYYE